MNDFDDDLKTARGLFNGVVISAAIWFVLWLIYLLVMGGG